jgi:hypothetical protein
MKKQKPAVLAVLYTTALFFAACTLEPPPAVSGAASGSKTGRVVISIAGAEDAPAPEAAAYAARTLLPEFGVLKYTITITKTGDATPVFTQTITTTSAAADLDAGSYTVSVSAKNSGDTLVAEGSGPVSVSLGVESPVMIRLASAASGTGTFEYTVTIPADPPVKSGVIEFTSIPGGTNPSPVDLSAGLEGTVSAGSASLPAGFYRAVLKVEVLGKRVAKTMVIHISDQTTTSAEFNLAIGDFVPAPPAGGSVIYIATQEELAAIGDHIGSPAMNYGKNAYVLLNDINLNGVWTPIGNATSSSIYISGVSDWSAAFQGNFFGENHRVTGLKLPNAAAQFTGLFGAVHKALVQDLIVETAAGQIALEQKSTHAVGFVAGGAHESDLINITVMPAAFTVRKPAVSRTDLFGGVAGTVCDSRLRGITVAGASGSSLSFLTDTGNTTSWNLYIGGIAGVLDDNSEISESAVSLNINLSQTDNSLQAKLGGIAGANNGIIRRSSYAGTLNISHAGPAPQTMAGGIAGNNAGTVETCYALPRITIGSNITSDAHRLYTGGLAGQNSGTLRNSYAACETGISVTSTSTMRKEIFSGGVVGVVPSSAFGEELVEKCYAAGSLEITVNGTRDFDRIYAGGIHGGDYKETGSSYSYGTVSSSAALVHRIDITTTGIPPASSPGSSRIIPLGNGTGTLSNNIAFNNMFVNGVTVADAVSNPQNDMDGLGKTAAQLQTQSTYETGLGWDFTTVWEMGPTEYPYPMLKWQKGTVLIPPGFELLN